MPEVGASTIDSSRGMKVAMKRKINPIARRQENIYDLHGRPLYLGAGGTVMVVESSSSRSPPRQFKKVPKDYLNKVSKLLGVESNQMQMGSMMSV